MALTGCLQIIAIVSFVFIILYFLQDNLFGENKDTEHFEENDMNAGLYDVSPDEELSSKLQMPSKCECQGECRCGHGNVGNADYPNSPSCPTGVIDESSGFPNGNDGQNASCFPKDQLTPEELLPANECNTWSKSNPNGSGQLADRNFLQAGWATGVSTVGSTLRNANLQLRSEIPNPQLKVSPWLQTTINPDFSRKPLEVGGCSS